jgi:D-alanyl-D-alanine carboxypeptidase/D-alanyl-D-alanine-endopeptidase (penicillin-binding protein 4)
MMTHPHFSTFHDSLVIAGLDGTLERRMRGSLAVNNFRGKTGTLTFANALSGYLTTKNGQMLILSIMGNNYPGPGRDVTLVIDQICTMLAEYDAPLP